MKPTAKSLVSKPEYRSQVEKDKTKYDRKADFYDFLEHTYDAHDEPVMTKFTESDDVVINRIALP